MKKKATARPAKATSRQSTLNFPTSSEADLVAESPAAETATKSGAKNRRKRTADFADDVDKHNKPQCDLSAISAQSAVKTTSRSEGQCFNAERPSWSNLPLSDLVHSIDQGWSPRCENYAASSHSEWAVIKTTAIQNLQFLDQENKALPSTLEPRKHLELCPGDLLITRAGPRNRVGVACLVRSTRPRLMLCDKAYRLKCRLDVVEPAFLELALNSPDLVSQVNKLKTGINDSGVNITQTPFMNLKIRIPPLPEQHRIVAEIEKQFTRLDAGVAALKRVQANLKRYRAAVLKAACEGKLVPAEAELARQEGRTYETGEQLLQRILTERRQIHERANVEATRKTKYKEPTLPTVPIDQELPNGWTWASWDQIGLSQNGRPFPSKHYTSSGMKLLRPGNLHVSGKVVWSESNTRCMPKEFAADNPDLIVSGGELVMNLTAQSLKDEFLGRVCITDHAEECLLNQRLARLTPVTVSTKFVLCLLKAWRFRRYVDGLNSGSLIQHMFTSQLAAFTFPLPPLAEQTRIVAEIERRLSVVDGLETAISTNMRRASSMRQSILQKAFSGVFTTKGNSAK